MTSFINMANFSFGVHNLFLNLVCKRDTAIMTSFSENDLIGEGPPEMDGYIEPSIPPDQVRQDPYPLPKEFEWSTIDLNLDDEVRYAYVSYRLPLTRP